jgi:adenylate kinase
MAPLAESVVDDLKQHIARLEGRIAELEGKLAPQGSSGSSLKEGVRMILIGPPGAGASSFSFAPK